MSNTIKEENKLEESLNYNAWKKRIDLIPEKNKALDLVKGKLKKSTKKSRSIKGQKRRDRDQANFSKEVSPKKNMMEGPEVKDLFARNS